MWNRVRGLAVIAGVVAAGATSVACGGKRVMVPPRFDLLEYRPVGLVTFTIENAKGSLNELATQRFAEELFAGQGRIELLELGEAASVLAEIGADRLGPDAARAIGERYGVSAVFVGHMTVSDVTPRIALGDLVRARAEASVNVEITTRLLSAESGATLWTSRAAASETVGELGFDGGEVFFGAENPDEAYGRLVDVLVYELTYDFRPSWVRS